MKTMNLGLAAPNLVCICVDNVKDNRIRRKNLSLLYRATGNHKRHHAVIADSGSVL